MFKLSTITHAVLMLALGLASVDAIAVEYKYRILNKGIRGQTGGTTGTTGTGGTSGTQTGGTGTGTGTGTGGGTTPAPTYATSGAQFLRNGTVVTQFFISANSDYPLVIKNTSTIEMRGWLGNSRYGLAYADMSRSNCGQTASVPTILAPGASCSFILVAGNANYDYQDDYFSLKSLSNAVIPVEVNLQNLEVSQDPTPPPNPTE